MKIVLVSSFVPFINGGARFIVEWLEEKLLERGHQVERFYIPFVDEPTQILEQMAAFRLMDLSAAGDRLVAFRPPAHVIRHPHKILWFIHHIRVFYDLWGTAHSLPPTPANEAIRRTLTQIDTATINEARKVFTNSQVVSDRLMKFNGIASEPLYPPIFNPERLVHDSYGDEIVAISRVEPHKRQMLLLDAMRLVDTPVRLRISGKASSPAYAREIQAKIADLGLQDRVIYEDRWISEEEKAQQLAGALAVAYVPIDEDGLGYPCLEGAHALKATITTNDSGAVLEFVTHERNGLVVDPQASAVAQAMDSLYRDRDLARRLGQASLARLTELAIDWDRVIEAIVA